MEFAFFGNMTLHDIWSRPGQV